jgi:hypothetical protein
MAKMRPDSFTPRMFASVISTMSATPRGTRWSLRPENAGIDTIAATPAEIDTATVST